MVASLLLALTPITSDRIQVTVDGTTREAIIVRPSKGSGPSPVVFGYHGHGGTDGYAERRYGLQEGWPEAVVVYPLGTPTKGITDPLGKKNGWTCNTSESNPDLRFFDVLFKKVMKEYNGDPKRVFAMGHSNGGQFMYTLWGMRGSLFAGFGSFEAGSAGRYKLTPKAFYITIGDKDSVVPPAFQRRSLDVVLKVNGAKKEGTKYAEKATLYPGIKPTVFWSYDGDHTFPADAVPSMLRFFKDQSL